MVQLPTLKDREIWDTFRDFLGLKKKQVELPIKVDPDIQTLLWKYYQLVLKQFTLRQVEGYTTDKERLELSFGITQGIITKEFADDIETLVKKRIANHETSHKEE